MSENIKDTIAAVSYDYSKSTVFCMGGSRSDKEIMSRNIAPTIYIYSVMTDTVTKNLQVEKEVSKILDSAHIPQHLLCKSHTCEKLKAISSMLIWSQTGNLN